MGGVQSGSQERPDEQSVGGVAGVPGRGREAAVCPSKWLVAAPDPASVAAGPGWTLLAQRARHLPCTPAAPVSRTGVSVPKHVSSGRSADQTP